jgi:hypothetical protein
MEKLIIREAIKSDKTHVLKFCKNTFSWGDYIHDVWNSWLNEGNLFIVENHHQPVGLCHAFFINNEVWIEGVRINSDFRRLGLASKLIRNVESLAKKNLSHFSLMLIDYKNNPSLSMAKTLDYQIFEIWHFYVLSPKVNKINKVKFANSLNSIESTYYIQSWRWIVLDNERIRSLCSDNKIIYSNRSGLISIAILTESDHFENTLIVTLYSGSKSNNEDLISYIQNYGIEKNYKRIQILTKEKLSIMSDLEYKITFYLMRKSLF